MKNLNYKVALLALLFSTAIFSQDLAVYVSDAANFSSGPWQIAKFNETGDFQGALIDVNDGLVWPQDIVFLDNEEAVLISNLGAAGTISKHHWNTGAFIQNFAEGIAGPTRMKIGPDGLLYVLQWSNSNNKILRYDLDGTFVDEFTDVGVPQSIGIDWDNQGDLYVSSYNGSSVRKFNGSSGADMGLFISGGLQGPTNIWFEPDGNMIVLSYNGGAIKRYDPDGNFIADLVTGLSGPEGFDFFPNGDLLIGNGGDGSIKRYDSQFNFIENFIEPGILLTPNAIVIRDDISLGIPENNAKAVFVTPTIGNQFYFNSAMVENFKALSVYNNSGQLVESISTKDTDMWDACNYAEGLYFIAVYEGGKKLTQKIIIKSN
jgi:WD40 repeat protein